MSPTGPGLLAVRQSLEKLGRAGRAPWGHRQTGGQSVRPWNDPIGLHAGPPARPWALSHCGQRCVRCFKQKDGAIR